MCSTAALPCRFHFSAHTQRSSSPPRLQASVKMRSGLALSANCWRNWALDVRLKLFLWLGCPAGFISPRAPTAAQAVGSPNVAPDPARARSAGRHSAVASRRALRPLHALATAAARSQLCCPRCAALPPISTPHVQCAPAASGRAGEISALLVREEVPASASGQRTPRHA